MCWLGRTSACLSLSFFVFQCAAARGDHATSPPAISVGRAAGRLAVSEAIGGPWRAIEAPEVLPERCWLRSAPLNASRLDLPGAALHIAPNSRLEVDAHERLIRLADGRLAWQAVESADDAAKDRRNYSVETAARTVQIEPGGMVELSADDSGGATLRLVRGAGSVDGQRFDTATAVRWRAGAAPPEASPLSSADRDRIAAWTAPPQNAAGIGRLLVRNARTNTIERLNTARYHVNVVLRPPVALVQIDQAFFNPNTAEREGAFAIDLPPGASVSRFAMYVANDRLIEGELIARQRAVEIHNTIVRGRHEPTLLEQGGDNLFQMRVFPIPGRGVKRVLLDYTIPLAADGSHYRFRLPLASEAEPILDFRVTGEIHPFGGRIAAEEVASPSHPDVVRHGQADGSVTLSLARRQYQPPAEFVVSFPAAREQPPTAVRSYRARGRAGDAIEDDMYYFLAQINRRGRTPPAAPADVLILADTSSGITEQDAVRQMATSIVKNLRSEDRFQLGCVDVAYRPLTKSWVVPDSPDASAACAAIDRQIFLGETDLIGCFKQALEDAFASSHDRRRVAIYIGDGANAVSDGAPVRDTLSERLDEALNDAGAALAVYLVPVTVPPNSPQLAALIAAQGAPLSALQIAAYSAALSAPNRMNFLRLAPIAQASGGVLFDGRHPAQAAGELFQWLLSGLPTRPRLNKIEIDGGRPEELYYLPDAVGDGSIQLLGRTTRPGRAKLTLSLTEGTEPSVEAYEIEIGAQVDDTFLGRLWAQRRVDELAAQDPKDKTPELTEIVELSQEWSLLSPYTAILVLEAESDYARWEIDRLRRRRYWQPAETLVSIAPPPTWLRPPDERPADKEAEAERFGTLLAPARESIAQGDYQGAWARLESLRPLPSAGASSEFAELAKRALAGLRRSSIVDRLGVHRRLIDPLAKLDPLRRSFRAGRLLSAPNSPEFRRIQPHADRWLEELDVFGDSWTLEKWAKLLAERTGVSVTLDRKELKDAGINERTRLEVVGYGRLSLRSLLRHAFRRAGVVVIDEPHRFLITSREAEENRLTTHVYPVADLLTPGKSADWGLLANPYLDREESVRRQISARLAQPISLSYAETPLRKVIEQFAARLKAAVVIDVKAVDEACISLTKPITAAWRDAPLGESLRWALDDLDLTYTLRDEALTITSKTEAENLLRVGLHSGRGLVYEYLRPVGPDGQPRGMGGMGMGGGGFGGGFGGGVGAEPPLARPVGLGFEPAARLGASTAQTAVQMAAQTAALGQPFAASRLLDASAAKPAGVFVPDAESVIGMVTSTIEPVTWDEVGGPGTVRFFDPTLDFVFDATDEIHEQIERLFSSLRKLPQATSHGPTAGRRWQIARPAEMRKGAKGIWQSDLTSLMDLIGLITSSIEPTTWDEVGGPGAIREDSPRLALVVSQTQEVHGGLVRLFTLLRRSRYAAEHDDRPWEADFLNGLPFDGLSILAAGRDEIPGGRPSQAVPSLTPVRDGLGRPSSEQAPVDSAALAALAAVRREPREGSWRWEHSREGAAESIGLRRQEGRMELDLGEQLVRIDGPDAAVVFPGMALAEIGPWSEAAGKLADGYLPWLPHRTNEELARMFTIEALPAAEREQQGRQLRIRLHFWGLEDGERAYIEAAFSHEHGLPTAWEAFVDGELTMRLRFKDLVDYGGQREWRQTVLEDANGVEIAAWRLANAEGGDAVASLAASSDAFAGLMVVDRRPMQAAHDADFAAALAALRQYDWAGADRRLAKALASHPHQPLLLFLRAWCHARNPVGASDAQARDWLAAVASSPAVALTRVIADGQFPFLSVDERFDLLARQPAALRTPLDERHLAQAAQAAGRLEAALAHVVAARRLLANEAAAAEPFELIQLQVEILLHLDRKSEAAQAAWEWSRPAGPEGAPPDAAVTAPRLILLAELLRQSAMDDAADRLLGLALDRPDLKGADRYDLLMRRANCHRGLERWKWMARAIDVANPDADSELSRLREVGLAALVDELHGEEHADAAARLAEQCQSEALRTRLLVRQAELTKRLPGVELCWRLAQSHRLPADRLSWAAARFNQAGQPRRTVELIEGELRAGRYVMPVAMHQLGFAYLLLDRPSDSRRAATADPSLGYAGMGMF